MSRDSAVDPEPLLDRETIRRLVDEAIEANPDPRDRLVTLPILVGLAVSILAAAMLCAGILGAVRLLE